MSIESLGDHQEICKGMENVPCFPKHTHKRSHSMTRINTAIVCLFVCMLFVGSAMAEGAPIRVVPGNLDALQTTEDRDNATAASAAKGANDFAFRLSAALVSQAGDGNFICSPYSVWLPLAALVNATDEQHKPQLLEALGAAGISGQDLNQAASRMLYDLTRRRFMENDTPTPRLSVFMDSGHNPLCIANAIFVSKEQTLKQSFAETFANDYCGSAINVDFSSPDAVDAINRWASESTEGFIGHILESVDPQTVATIANAIYFSDRWMWEFNVEETEEGIFTSPSGETQAFFMLREGVRQRYYEDDKVQAMPLDFMTGGGLCIILPKDGNAVGLLSSMTSAYFDRILRDTEYATGKLLLPRFSIDSDMMDLANTLTSLGVPLFDGEAAALTGGLLESDISVYLSGALQKAVIKVDEMGTTAAAVTVMPLAGAGRPKPTEPFEMICNRPFVFVLYGETTDGGRQILFTGVVNKP